MVVGCWTALPPSHRLLGKARGEERLPSALKTRVLGPESWNAGLLAKPGPDLCPRPRVVKQSQMADIGQHGAGSRRIAIEGGRARKWDEAIAEQARKHTIRLRAEVCSDKTLGDM